MKLYIYIFLFFSLKMYCQESCNLFEGDIKFSDTTGLLKKYYDNRTKNDFIISFFIYGNTQNSFLAEVLEVKENNNSIQLITSDKYGEKKVYLNEIKKYELDSIIKNARTGYYFTMCHPIRQGKTFIFSIKDGKKTDFQFFGIYEIDKLDNKSYKTIEENLIIYKYLRGFIDKYWLP